MGVHLMLCRKSGGVCERELGWDGARYHGDRDFAALIGRELPVERVGDGIYEDIMERPADFAKWREVIAARDWPNPGRFEQLTDILEANPDVWLYVSY